MVHAYTNNDGHGIRYTEQFLVHAYKQWARYTLYLTMSMRGSCLQTVMSTVLLLFLLVLLKKDGSALSERESDIHPISPKTAAPQYQPVDRKKRKGKIVDDYSRDRAV